MEVIVFFPYHAALYKTLQSKHSVLHIKCKSNTTQSVLVSFVIISNFLLSRSNQDWSWTAKPKLSLPHLNKMFVSGSNWRQCTPYPDNAIFSMVEAMCQIPKIGSVCMDDSNLSSSSLRTLMRVTRSWLICSLITILQCKGKLHLDKLIWQAWRFNFFNNDTADKIQAGNRPTLRRSYCDKGWIWSQRNGVYSQTHHEKSNGKLHNC